MHGLERLNEGPLPALQAYLVIPGVRPNQAVSDAG
jgi:hypothetical protein